MGSGLGPGAAATAVAHVLSASLGLQSLGRTRVGTSPFACANDAPRIAAMKHSTRQTLALEIAMLKPAPTTVRS